MVFLRVVHIRKIRRCTSEFDGCPQSSGGVDEGAGAGDGEKPYDVRETLVGVSGERKI